MRVLISRFLNCVRSSGFPKLRLPTFLPTLPHTFSLPRSFFGLGEESTTLAALKLSLFAFPAPLLVGLLVQCYLLSPSPGCFLCLAHFYHVKAFLVP